MNPRCAGHHAVLLALSAGVLLAPITTPEAVAAGFEVGEHTPTATARGGTGASNTDEASAIYFNPALLGRVQGTQVLLSANLYHLSAQFQRDDFFRRSGGEPTHTFDLATNQTGPFPIPFAAAKFDVGPEALSFGVGLFSPSAYGNPCFGVIEDGDCRPEEIGAARGMVVEANMVVVYAGAGVSYSLDLGEDRTLDLGLTAVAAIQNSSFGVVVDADPEFDAPWREDPANEAFVLANGLFAIAPTGILGIAYSDGPMRLGLSYRPPIRWRLTGSAEVEFSDFLESQSARLTDDEVHFETWHAGSLRLGWGAQWGEHPADSTRPRWDVEVNAVWENWSVVDTFRIDLEGDLEVELFGTTFDYPFEPIYQQKGYQDTWSLRAGVSFGVNSRATGHVGGFLETAAQPIAYTSADFFSWERYAPSLGATFHLPANLDLSIGYTYIYSPSRTVSQGRVYNPIPLSNCRGPDFDAEHCTPQGQPPGNPPNEGQWESNFQILSAGLTWTY